MRIRTNEKSMNKGGCKRNSKTSMSSVLTLLLLLRKLYVYVSRDGGIISCWKTWLVGGYNNLDDV